MKLLIMPLLFSTFVMQNVKAMSLIRQLKDCSGIDIDATPLQTLASRKKFILGSEFSGTKSGLKVKDELRILIQDQRNAMIDLSKKEDYYGHGIKCDSNHCHGASRYLKRVLLENLGLDATIVTFEPRLMNKGGFEHSFLIIKDFFGKSSPLVIDATIKQFMPVENRIRTHDIFVGSPEEFLAFIRDHEVDRGNEGQDSSFIDFMNATETGRFD